jgi:hypothetical protein
MVDIRASRSPSAHDYRCPFIWRMDFLGMAKVKGFMVRIGPHHYGLAQCPDDPGGIISSNMSAVPSRRLEAPEPRAT